MREVSKLYKIKYNNWKKERCGEDIEEEYQPGYQRKELLVKQAIFCCSESTIAPLKKRTPNNSMEVGYFLTLICSNEFERRFHIDLLIPHRKQSFMRFHHHWELEKIYRITNGNTAVKINPHLKTNTFIGDISVLPTLIWPFLEKIFYYHKWVCVDLVVEDR